MPIKETKELAQRYFKEPLRNFWNTIFRLANRKLADGWVRFDRLWLGPQLGLEPATVERQRRVNKLYRGQNPDSKEDVS